MAELARGERVAVYAPEESDRDEFIAARRASRDYHHPWTAPPTTRGEYDAFVRRSGLEQHQAFLVRRLDTGELAGYFNVSHIIRGALQSAFLGYSAVASQAGHGFMTDGLRLLLPYAWRELGLHRLEANVQPGNHASLALLERCGFVREGFSERYLRVDGDWRDHERWAARADA
jgi:ribosomal-protein-alanine N-acetyltransferase